MTFDIRDGANRYNPCPQCGATRGMGMTSTKNGVAVWCARCDFTGPEADRKGELWTTELDREAFDSWNALPRS